jgi:hypothetical protein
MPNLPKSQPMPRRLEDNFALLRPLSRSMLAAAFSCSAYLPIRTVILKKLGPRPSLTTGTMSPTM